VNGFSTALIPAPILSLNQNMMTSPAATMRWRSSESRALGLSIEGAAGPANSACSELSAVSRSYAQLRASNTRGGVALAWASKSLSSLDPSRDREGVSASAWLNVRSARVVVDARAHFAGVLTSLSMQPIPRLPSDTPRIDDTLRTRQRNTVDTTEVRHNSHALDLSTRLQWKWKKLALDVVAGGTAGKVNRLSTPSTRSDSLVLGDNSPQARNQVVVRGWARGEMRLSATRFLDITAAVAALPEQPYLGAPARRVAVIGMAFSGLPRSSPSSGKVAATARTFVESVRKDSSTVIIRLRIAKAKHVELSGEPTSWTPISMKRADDDWWEVALNAPPGSYRVNVRIDGHEWIAPPGTVPSRDEFGGEVGVIQIR
jgi:hypothetical protein